MSKRGSNTPTLLLIHSVSSTMAALQEAIYSEKAVKYFDIKDFVGMKHHEAVHKLMGRGWSRKDATWLLQASRLRGEFETGADQRIVERS